MHLIFLITAVLTFALVLLGGFVHSTGSSLACPDWPLCFGQVFPNMVGGVAIEHSHRLLASLIGLFTVTGAVLAWKNRSQDRRTMHLAFIATALVIAQGVLGGITVIFKLPLAVSTAHLATAMLFGSLILTLVFRTRTKKQSLLQPISRRLHAFWWAVVAGTYLQIVLGALVRHTGSGFACGEQWVLCNGSFFPAWGPGALHMLHRGGALLITGITLLSAWFVLREVKTKTVRRHVAIQLLLLVVQIILGVTNLVTYLHVAAVTAHLGVGALLLANAWFVKLSLGSPRVDEANQNVGSYLRAEATW